MLPRETMDTPRTCLKIDADTFRSHFNLRPFLFSHNLSRHPLFQLPRLIKLAKTLDRSEEHTSELQSRGHLVCRLLLEKKKQHTRRQPLLSPSTALAQIED